MMRSVKLGKDTLLEIATFLARRWSETDDVSVEFSDKNQVRTWLAEKKIILLPPDRYQGEDFQRYRQLRTSLWYEAIRIKHCKKILSNDHAFGFILNTIETRRIETIGRRIWRGMDAEIVFGYSYALNYRPALRSLYGKARIVEAFYQMFLFGGIKGEIQDSSLEKIQAACIYADGVLEEATRDGHDTEWVEKKIPEIIRILGIDSLLTIPVSLPWTRRDMALTPEELRQTMIRISKNRYSDFGDVDADAALEGQKVYDEYKTLVDEDKKNSNRGLGDGDIGVEVPSADNVDETKIYDMDLVNRLKARFKDWRSGLSEQHLETGDEFDEEYFIDGAEPFFVDVKKTARTRMVILLDHSSSIYADQNKYKKTTLALCKVLSYLKIDFAVYAFSTQNRSVVCWLIKPNNAKWNHVCEKRLARIVANGATPLAEVYGKMLEAIRANRPKIFLTLTDGEPSDPGAVRAMIKSLRSLGVSMVALGFAPDVIRAVTIASNLKTLDYERTLAVSRLEDIPARVLGILEGY